MQGKNLRRLSFLCDKDKQPSKPSQKAAVATTDDAFFSATLIIEAIIIDH